MTTAFQQGPIRRVPRDVVPWESPFTGDAVTALVAALTENAQRLGLKPLIRPGAVVDGTNPAAVKIKIDGDTTQTTVTSMVGELYPAQRVFLFIMPGVGAYVIGFVGPRYLAHRTSFTNTASTRTVTSYANLTNIAGTSFFAPASGVVTILCTARLTNSTATAGAALTFWIGEGPDVGQGTEILAASDTNMLLKQEVSTASRDYRFTGHHTQEGLVPGKLYNVSMQGRTVTAATATFSQIRTTVVPSP